MKSLISLVALAMFSVAMVGCHASVDTDDTSSGSSSHYKKTTTYGNGEQTTKTETTVTK